MAITNILQMYKFYSAFYSIQNYNTIMCTTYIHHSISYMSYIHGSRLLLQMYFNFTAHQEMLRNEHQEIYTIHTRTILMYKFVQMLRNEHQEIHTIHTRTI